MNTRLKSDSYTRDRKAVIELTQQLVQIPSVYRGEGVEGGNEEKVANYVAEHLKGIGIETHIEEVVPGRPNVIGIIDSGKPGKTLLFEGHTDVVTEGDRKAWKYDPFGAEIVDGRMYGRGTNDTKGNLACMITAVHSILQDEEEFSGKIILCIPCDEEGLMLGIKHFIKQGWAKGVDGAIICEPEENNVCIAQRGAIRLQVDFHGKMAHGAISWSGINPNWRLARFITKIEKLEKAETKRLGEDPYLKWPSITPTIIQSPVTGDAQINVIPDHCRLTLDIRTVPEQNHDILLQTIEGIVSDMKAEDSDCRIDLTVLDNRPPTATAKEDEVVKAIYGAVEEITGKEPIYNGVPGATDGTFLHMEGIPIVTIGAGDREIPHQLNEYVDIEELAETTAIFKEAALRFLNGRV
ncbi:MULTISPECIES: M20 family metallopeptidase [unclassified Planococcus (in: firmicutes)]|uniref:M20 family metallopeptidase n=1 Tax=unclassified Planococcus (in: firmicutes) TaxID=2662419 RepID=UPI000C31FA70|nr:MULTISPECIES: M20 family metallopeptidase [unclassified Planococcus (in: firmicutes)]AUD13055.1 peptidase M20 [Planococcus sp. MB-3u-03]PKG45462.1 peptidase M20 [Planococcus sp. Urea-trap-24]PKG88941.1 peptidase M20 [Planococcus sp. Urea-3u-39]PKH36309.1 peptidase M20 [Planococcus sp. MB-3u-09]